MKEKTSTSSKTSKKLATKRKQRGLGKKLRWVVLPAIAFFVITAFKTAGILKTTAGHEPVPVDDFVNFESAHVHPLDMTPDGTKLLAVNTAANTLEVFSITPNGLLNTASIPVGVDPVSVRARTNSEVWVANVISDNISIVDLSQEVVIRTLQTENEPSDIVFAGSPQRAFVSCAERESIQVFNLNNLNGNPQEILLIGEQPRAMSVSPDGNTVYTAFFESGNQTTVISGNSFIAAGGLTAPFSGTTRVPNDVRQGSGPYGGSVPVPNDGNGFNPPMNPNLPSKTNTQSLVVKKNNQTGQWVDDNGGNWTNIVSGGAGFRMNGWDMPDNDVAVLDANNLNLSYQNHLGNILMAMEVNPVSGEVSVVGTDAMNHIRFTPNLNGTFLRVNISQFIPGNSNNNITDLNDHLDYSTPSVPVSERQKSIGDPRGIAWRSNGQEAYVAGMGSNNLIIIDQNGDRVNSQPIEVGQGPTGIVLDESNNKVYVLNKFDASISTVDMSTDQEIAQTSFFDPTPNEIKIGRPHMYNTHLGSGNGTISCASCHVDAKWDRLAWDLGDPSGNMETINGRTFHPMKGLKVTQQLIDAIDKADGLLHWRGDKQTFAEFASAFDALQGTDAPLNLQGMNEMEDFLRTTYHPPNPYRENGMLNPANLDNIIRGPGTSFQSMNISPGFQGTNVIGFWHSACGGCHQNHTGRGPRFQTNPHRVISYDTQENIAADLRFLYRKLGFYYRSNQSTVGFGMMSDGVVDTHIGTGGGSTGTLAPAVGYLFDYHGLLMGWAGGAPTYSEANIRLAPSHESQDSHYAVGRIATLSPDAGSANEVNALRDFANNPNTLPGVQQASNLGLIVKGMYQGEHRGFVYLGGNNYQSDRTGQTVSHNDLLSEAQNAGPLTWIIVHDQEAQRLGIDRNLNGILDREETVSAAFTYDREEPYDIPAVVNFDASASDNPLGGNTTYTWDFGDGNSGTGITPQHNYASPDTFTVTLTVTDDASGDFDIATQQVIIIDGCAALVGQSCGDPCIPDGIIQPDCSCLGTPVTDSDGDGICDATDQAPNDPCTADGVADGQEPAGFVALAENDCDGDGITVGEGDQNDYDSCFDENGFTPTPECVCGASVVSGAGTFEGHTGVGNPQNVADGAPDGVFTGNIAGADRLNLSVPFMEAGGEVCITLGFNRNNGIVNIEVNGVLTSITNPNGSTSYSAQTVCVPVDSAGPQQIIISDGGPGNLRVDGTQYSYCPPCEPNDPDQDNDGVCDEADVCPNFDDNLIGTPCDDGNSCTENDIWVESCNCAGTPTAYDSEDFEVDMGIWIDGGTNARRINNSSWANSGNFSVELRSRGETSLITTPDQDFSAFDDITLEFSYLVRSFEGTEDFWVQVSIDGGSTFTTVEDYVRGTDFENDERKNIILDIQGPFTANTQLRFRADASGGGDFVHIDDVVIRACNEPENLAPVASFTASVTNGEAPLPVIFDASASSDDKGIVSYSWDYGDGNTATGENVIHTYLLAGSYTATLTVSDQEGLTNSRSVNITVTDEPVVEGDCFIANSQQRLWIEAENFSRQAAGSGNASASSWAVIDDPTAAAGKAVRAEPNDGVFTGLSVNGPRLDYDVYFDTPGDYAFYVRAQGATGSDDSFHAGLNGNPLTNTSGWGMSVPASWTWADEANDGVDVVITIPSPGKYTLNLWMREDGVAIDKLFLIPVGGNGPFQEGEAESSTGDCGGNVSNQAPLASFTATPPSGPAPLAVSFDGSASTDDKGVVSYSWDFGDGNTGSGATISNSYQAAGQYTATLTVSDQEGLTNSTTTQITVDNPGGGNCFAEVNGEVIIEAENFSRTTAGTGNASETNWVSSADPNASGGTVAEAGPNRGVWTGLNLNGAGLEYDIDFSETGIYYVYIRSAGETANDDSYHIGLNGTGLSNQSEYGMGGAGAYSWYFLANQDEAMTLNIQSVGKQTFNIWMREDGVKIDKIVLKKVSGVPTGLGGAESGQSPCSGQGNQAPVASFSATPSAGFTPLEVSLDASASTDDNGITSYAWDFGDGQSGSGVSTTHTYVNPGNYTLSLTVTDAEGLSNSSSRNITVNTQGNGPLCFQETAGVVVIEAENYSSLIPGTGNASSSTWQSISNGEASNGTALQAMPNSGVYTGLALNGPRVDYSINFSTAGTYRIYIRTLGANGEDDSYHVGLNGVSVSTTNGYGMGLNGPWGWAYFANEDPFVEVVVPSTGQHTFNVWMREDGVAIDKIVLKVQPGSPSSQGPAESQRAVCPNNNFTNESFSVEEEGGNGEVNWGNFFEEFKDNYALERSIDGINFEVIETDEIIVDRILNEHTDPDIRQYEVNSITYRLKIKDQRGYVREERYGVLNLRTQGLSFDFKAYPIPANAKINIEYDNSTGKPLEMRVMNALGQTMHERQLEGSSASGTIKLDISSWAEGIYFVRMTDGENSQVMRILKE